MVESSNLSARFMDDKFKPMQCKFCRKDVLINQITNRIVEIDKVTLHIQNCPRRQEHFKNRSYEDVENRRRIARMR